MMGRGLMGVAVPLVFALACGGGADEEVDWYREITVDEFPGALASAACQRGGACGCPSTAGCSAVLVERYRDRAVRWGEAGLTYDATCGGQLVGDTRSQECGSGRLACRACAPFHGGVPAGGSCVRHEGVLAEFSVADDCAQGLQCDERAVCVARCPGIGDACGYGVECTEGYCADGVCRVRLAEGDPCPDDRACESELCVEGACSRYPTVGEPCGVGGSLHGGGACSAATCIDGVCVAPRAVGDPCADSLECFADTTFFTDASTRRLFCGPAGTCQPRGGLGAFCVDPDGYDCLTEYACENGVCVIEAGVCPNL